MKRGHPPEVAVAEAAAELSGAEPPPSLLRRAERLEAVYTRRRAAR